MEEMKQEIYKLEFKIDSKNPVQLTNLVSCFLSLNDEYDEFLRHNPHLNDGISKPSLAIKEVRTGSFIFDFISQANVTDMAFILPLLAQTNTVFEFSQYLINSYRFLKAKIPLKKEYKNTTKNLNSILNTVNGDNNIIYNFSIHNFNTETKESIIVDDLRLEPSEIIDIKRTLSSKELINNDLNKTIFNKQLLYFTQINSSEEPKKGGNRAIIESISKEPCKIFFDSNEIKQDVLQQKFPLKSTFIVDVEVQTKNGNPDTYTVRYIHQIDED